MKKKRLTTASLAFCISLIICLFSPLRLLADSSVTIDMGTNPGTLSEKLGDQIYEIQSLTIKGQINGTDLATLRSMMGLGFDTFYSNTKKLATLDLFNAKIVKGGEYKSGYTLYADDELPYSVFYFNQSLTCLITPSSLKSIGDHALAFPDKALTVSLNEGLEKIAWGAFAWNDFQSLYIPASVKDISYGFAYGCKNLTDITISPENDYYFYSDNAIYSKDGKTLTAILASYTGDFVIPDQCTFFEGTAQQQMRSLVGKNIKTVGDISYFPEIIALGASLESIYDLRHYGRSLDGETKAFYLGCTNVPAGNYQNNDSYRPIENAVIYVPGESLSAFQTHRYWSHAKEILPIENTEYAYLKIQDYKETYPRRMVVEEGTGTWCGWCVRGIVAMDYMKEQYPDNFIGIAIHSSDKMDCSDEYGLYFEYYPGAYYNRSYYGSVSKSVFLNQIQNSGLTTDKRVVISQIEPVADGIRVETKARVAKDISDVDYRLIYVITEDNVGPYNQNNAYAGGGNGAMGGFENMGSPVSLIYNDVARSIYPDNQGLPGSVPSVLQSFTDYVYEAEVPLPDNYSDYENLSLTVMLYDVETGEILNADRQKLTTEIQGDDDVPDFDDQALALVLHLRSGKKIAYQLDEQPVVTFDDNNIVIETLKSAIRYNATDALKFTYINTEDSGIDNVEMPDYFISVVENAILARGLEPGTEMSVYSTDGLLVASKTVDLNGEASVLLPDLKGKVYLVKTSVTTFKIVMK